MKLEIVLPRPVDRELAAQIEDQGVYAAPEVERLRVSEAGDRIVVDCCEGRPGAELRDLVEAYVRDFVSRYRRIAGRQRARYQRPAGRPLERDVFARLVERGWALELGPGQVGLSGLAGDLARALDGAWRTLARDRFDAAEQVYPTLIPTDVLRRCEYFSSFPHLVSLVSHFVGDYDQLERVRRANAGADAFVIPDPAAVAPPAACVTPATCYHCYQALEGRTLHAPGRAFTAVGRCARWEASNMTGLDRLWEFTMREIVFVGAETWVRDRREDAIAAVGELLSAWELDCSIESATDPFFAPMYATKSFWQSQSDLKYEMRLAVEPRGDEPRTISAGSFNLHEGFFGQTFDICLDDGSPVFTGCTAFGLERWVLAVFTQHGLDPERWPAALRAEL
jgi:seryl-tRNA synthetase